MLKLDYKSYDNDNSVEGMLFHTVEKIDTISFSYDGGRLTVTINGKTVYHTVNAGSDCNVDIEVQ